MLAWHRFVQQKNEEQPVVERKRTLPDGREQLFHTQTKLIPGNVEATGSRIILDYIRAYEHSFRHGFTPDHEEDLPSLFTNNSKLADKRTVSDRTIRNHISRLRQVGLISGYTFHGTYHDFELWISPEILFAEENQCNRSQLEAQKSAEIAAPAPPQCTNFPLNVAFETTGNIEKEISSVDKKGVASQQGAMPGGDGETSNTCDTFTGDTGLQQGRTPVEETPHEPLAAQKQDTEAGGAATARKPGVNPVFKSYVEIFWQYAYRMLYPGYEFEEEQHKMAKNAIWYGVYGGFKADLTEDEWELYHDQALQRIDLAATYYRNHQDKYPPMPYAEFVHGSGYFDWQNSLGFRSTENWLVKQQVWKHQQRVEDALRRARTDFRLHKKGKAKKRIQEKTQMQLFRFHEERIKRLGTDALNKYYKLHTNL